MDPAALASPLLATAVHPSSSREGMEGSFSGGGDDLQSKGDGGGARLGLQEREREDVREREKEGEEDKEKGKRRWRCVVQRRPALPRLGGPGGWRRIQS